MYIFLQGFILSLFIYLYNKDFTYKSNGHLLIHFIGDETYKLKYHLSKLHYRVQHSTGKKNHTRRSLPDKENERSVDDHRHRRRGRRRSESSRC
jgi:hypothetical protein